MRFAIAVLAFLLPAIAHAETAQDFLNRVYAPYSHGRMQGDAEKLLDPTLQTLWRQADAVSQKRQEQGPTNGDIFCNCQEPTVSRLRISVVPGLATEATGTVTFDISPAPRKVTVLLRLVLVNGQWRINDLSNNEGLWLRADLTRFAKG